MPKIISNEELHTAARFHKYATFAIVVFLIFLTFAIILIIGTQTTNDQAYRTITRAGGTTAMESEDDLVALPNQSFEIWETNKKGAFVPRNWKLTDLTDVQETYARIPGSRGQYALLIPIDTNSGEYGVSEKVSIDTTQTSSVTLRAVVQKTSDRYAQVTVGLHGKNTTTGTESRLCQLTFEPTREWVSYTKECKISNKFDKFFVTFARSFITNTDISPVAFDKVSIGRFYTVVPTSTPKPTLPNPTSTSIPTQPGACVPHCEIDSLSYPNAYCGYASIQKCNDAPECKWNDCTSVTPTNIPTPKLSPTTTQPTPTPTWVPPTPPP